MTVSNKTLTSANAVVQFKCEGIVDDYTPLKSFQADNMFDWGETTIGETVMSADGILHGGYVANQTAFNVHLTPDSESMDLFERCRNYFVKNKETVKMSFRVTMPSLKKQASFNAFMISSPNMQFAKLVGMGAYAFETDFEGYTDNN